MTFQSITPYYMAHMDTIRFWVSYFVYLWGGTRRFIGTRNNSKREFEAAVRSFDLAARIDPSFTRAKLDQAVILWRELSQPKEALAILDKLIAKDQNTTAALFNRANIYQELWYLQPAIDDLERYLALSSPDDVYWEMAVRNMTHLRDTFDDLDAASQK